MREVPDLRIARIPKRRIPSRNLAVQSRLQTVLSSTGLQLEPPPTPTDEVAKLRYLEAKLEALALAALGLERLLGGDPLRVPPLQLELQTLRHREHRLEELREPLARAADHLRERRRHARRHVGHRPE